MMNWLKRLLLKVILTIDAVKLVKKPAYETKTGRLKKILIIIKNFVN